MRDMIARMGILGELLQFLWRRKLYWLIPMIIMLALFIVLIILEQQSRDRAVHLPDVLTAMSHAVIALARWTRCSA